MKLSVVILISSVLCVAYCTEYQKCKSKSGEVLNVTVSDSDTQEKCILKRGTNATVTIDFKLTSESESNVLAVCHGKVGGIDVPFRLPNPDACKDSGLDCPLKKDTQYSYEASFPVLKIYPKVAVIVKYELKTDQSDDIVCIEIPCKIV